MAVYRQRRRSYLLPAVGVAVAVAAVVVAALLLTAGGEDPSQRLSRAVTTMTAQLDVLAVSHYTDATVADGAVLQPDEHAAALQDLETLRSEWQAVRTLADGRDAPAIDQLVERIESMISRNAPPSEVAAMADELARQLKDLR